VTQLATRGLTVTAAQVQPMLSLFKDRCATAAELAGWLAMYFEPVQASEADLQTHVTDAVRPALAALAQRLQGLADWNKAAIQQALKETLVEAGLKMPQLAIPVRVLVCGRAQTPSLDAVLELFDKKIVLERLQTR